MTRRRRWAWVAAVLAAPFLALLLGIVVPRPLWSSAEPEAAMSRILVLAGPIHTDIALPLDDATRARFAFLADDGMQIGHPGAEWLILGWGGRAFYLETPTWRDLRPGPVLRALTLDASVMHVDLAGPIPLPLDGALALDVGPSQRARIEDVILAGFARVDGRAVVVPGAAYGDFDRFFEAEGSFNLVLGCNTWTAAVLRAGGLRTGWWTPLPSTLLASLRLHGRRRGALRGSGPPSIRAHQPRRSTHAPGCLANVASEA